MTSTKTPEEIDRLELLAASYACDYRDSPNKTNGFPDSYLVYSIAYDAFLAGYKAAQQWISVEERLPEWHEDVLAITVHCSFREMKVVRYEPNYGFDFNGIITHWMPLPAPPKEEK